MGFIKEHWRAIILWTILLAPALYSGELPHVFDFIKNSVPYIIPVGALWIWLEYSPVEKEDSDGGK